MLELYRKVLLVSNKHYCEVYPAYTHSLIIGITRALIHTLLCRTQDSYCFPQPGSLFGTHRLTAPINFCYEYYTPIHTLPSSHQIPITHWADPAEYLPWGERWGFGSETSGLNWSSLLDPWWRYLCFESELPWIRARTHSRHLVGNLWAPEISSSWQCYIKVPS